MTSKITKPILMHPGRRLPYFLKQLQAIPDDLKKRKQWVMWRLMPDWGKRKKRKVPFSIDGRAADVTSARDYTDFDSAVAGLRTGGFNGIGFALTEADPYCGIDLDNCCDPKTGAIEPWALEIVQKIDSYTEASPSGKGLHIWAHASLEGLVRNRKGNVEMYDRGRYLTMNGAVLAGRSVIRHAQKEIAELHAVTFGAPQPADSFSTKIAMPTIADREVIEKLAFGADHKATGLWFGQWQEVGYSSQSEADLALCGYIARFSNDATQIDRVFRESSLFRDKWDEHRGEETYGFRTVTKALQSTAVDGAIDALAHVNAEFAVIGAGDQVRILQEISDANPDEPPYRLLSPGDFATVVRNRRSPDSGKSVATWWLGHAGRRELRGIEFNPRNTTPGYYNVWRGFGIRAKEGTCAQFWAFVFEVICRSDETAYTYVRKYFAHLVQRPYEIAEVAIVMRGGQGTGKNTFADTFGKLVGRHYRTVSRMDQVSGRFNSHLQGALVVHANEALWGGNKADGGSLKALISDTRIAIEGKGRDILNTNNFARVIISSNEAWPVGIDADDRRCLVLDVSPARQQDANYFAEVHRELQSGGYEALMFELEREDITGFHPRNRPPTRYGWDIKIESADSVTRWAYDWLSRGSVPAGACDTLPCVVASFPLYQAYATYAKETGERRIVDQGVFFRRLEVLLPGCVDTTRPAAGHGATRYRMKTFASLEACRDAFEVAMNSVGSIPWEGGHA